MGFGCPVTCESHQKYCFMWAHIQCPQSTRGSGAGDADPDTQLRCIPALIRAGNKAALLLPEKKEKQGEREGGRGGWEGRKGKKKNWKILNFNNTGTIL